MAVISSEPYRTTANTVAMERRETPPSGRIGNEHVYHCSGEQTDGVGRRHQEYAQRGVWESAAAAAATVRRSYIRAERVMGDRGQFFQLKKART